MTGGAARSRHDYGKARAGGSYAPAPDEVLIFRDYTGWEEPALATPLGFWSLRNLAVFGMFGMITYVLYTTVLPENISIGRDWATLSAVMAPLATGLIISMIKTPYGTADTIMAALFIMMLRGNNSRRPSPGGRGKAPKSTVLGFPRRLEVDAPQSDRIHEIACADLDELKSIRITIYGPDGHAMPNRLVKCYLDDVLVDSIHTGSDGSLVLHVRPEREGGRMLTVREYDGDRTLLRRPLHFALNRTGGMGRV